MKVELSNCWNDDIFILLGFGKNENNIGIIIFNFTITIKIKEAKNG